MILSRIAPCLASLLLIGGCAATPAPLADSGSEAANDTPDAAYSMCSAGRLEDDLQILPGADAGTAIVVPAGSYIVSTTYLPLVDDPAAQQLFQQRSTAVIDSLPATDGIVAYRIALSSQCLSARTLVVWRDEASMYRFVSGTAHTAAMAVFGQINRGGGAVLHWDDDGHDVSFERAAQQFAQNAAGGSDGP